MNNKKENSKRPTAKKRMIQNAKARKRNNLAKAKLKSSMNVLSNSENKVQDIASTQSVIDKASKTRAISQGRANRLKSKIYKNL
ncbi:MAG: 30S ribosomal protein S20 [Chlamydiia bacterium]|nr:30S ribosomal protein S20 [Chlamydiia bacterium]